MGSHVEITASVNLKFELIYKRTLIYLVVAKIKSQDL